MVWPRGGGSRDSEFFLHPNADLPRETLGNVDAPTKMGVNLPRDAPVRPNEMTIAHGENPRWPDTPGNLPMLTVWPNYNTPELLATHIHRVGNTPTYLPPGYWGIRSIKIRFANDKHPSGQKGAHATLSNGDLTLRPPMFTSRNRSGMRNRRTFGYLVDIQEGQCDKEDTPFNCTVVARILFTSDDGTPG